MPEIEQKLGLCKVDVDNFSFIDIQTKEVFVPFGVNYYDPDTGWAPKMWSLFNEERTDHYFALMADYGVNLARVFTAGTVFLPNSNQVEETSLVKLDKLIEISRRYNIRLLITGPDNWEGIPDYNVEDRFANDEALKALQCFWTVMANRYKDEPMIFAWDLLNEPMINWASSSMKHKWQFWLKEKYNNSDRLLTAWGNLQKDEALEKSNISIPPDLEDEGNSKLYDFQLFREEIAKQWAEIQVNAIRAAGDQHMITIGYIQWVFPKVRGWEATAPPSSYAAFNPMKLNSLLDFNSIHFYPPLGDPIEPTGRDRNIQYLKECIQYCSHNKPVVLEEFGWYGGGAINELPARTQEDLANWNSAVIRSTVGIVSGWVAWPFSDCKTSTDISKYGGLITFDEQEKKWGASFRSISKVLSRAPMLKSEGCHELIISESEWKYLLTGKDKRNDYTGDN